MERSFNIQDINELPEVSKKILDFTFPNKKFILYGNMGVGKTTLIKALSLHLGVRDIVSSPTFSIVNEYITSNEEKIYHFDFYRVNNEEEVYDIGYEEYFFSNSYCFIEWPDKIENLIEDNMIRVFITQENNNRIIKVKK